MTFFISVTSELLIACEMLPEEIGDICWMNSSRLAMQSSSRFEFFILDIDFDTSTCNSTRLKAENDFDRFGCNEQNEVYIIENQVSSIEIINVETGQKRRWQPDGVSIPGSIAMNKEFIIVQEMWSPNIYIFGRDEKLYAKRNVGGHGYHHFLYDISHEGVVLLYNSPTVVLHDVHQDKTIDVTLERQSTNACMSPSNEMFVSTVDGGPNLDIYSMKGNFLRKLHFDLIHEDTVRALAVMPWVDKPFTMALNTVSNKTEMRIYRLS